MKRLIVITVIAIVLCITACAVYAEIPKAIQYQGKLTDPGGNPIEGDTQITFRIYNAETGGTLKWNETQTAGVENGIFSVLLGSVTPIGLAFDEDYWLSIQVGGDPEMTPRQKLASVGYAFRAQTAENVTGGITIPFYISGLELKRIGPSEIVVSPGAIDIAGTLHTLTEPMILNEDGDTWVFGTKPSTGWVYVYAGAVSGELVLKFSTEAPDLSDHNGSTSYTPLRYQKYPDTTEGICYRCIGAICNENGTIVKFYQSESYVIYDEKHMVMQETGPFTWKTVTCANYVPAIAELVQIEGSTYGVTQYLDVRRYGSTSDVGIMRFYGAGSGAIIASHGFIMVDSDRRIECRKGGGENPSYLYIVGYVLSIR